jgi:putative membrane protein
VEKCVDKLERSQLNVPLVVYISNFVFAAGLSLGSGYAIPVLLGFVGGVVPALALWWRTANAPAQVAV